MRDGFLAGVLALRYIMTPHSAPTARSSATPQELELQHVTHAGVSDDVLQATGAHPFVRPKNAQCAMCVRLQAPTARHDANILRTSTAKTLRGGAAAVKQPFTSGSRRQRHTHRGFQCVRDALREPSGANACIDAVMQAVAGVHHDAWYFGLGAVVAVHCVVQRSLRAVRQRRRVMLQFAARTGKLGTRAEKVLDKDLKLNVPFTRQVGYQVHMQSKAYAADIQDDVARRVGAAEKHAASIGGSVTPVRVANAVATRARDTFTDDQYEPALRFAFTALRLEDYDATPYFGNDAVCTPRAPNAQELCAVCTMLIGPFPWTSAWNGNAADSAYGTCLPPVDRTQPMAWSDVARVLDAVERLGVRSTTPLPSMNAAADAVLAWMQGVFVDARQRKP